MGFQFWKFLTIAIVINFFSAASFAEPITGEEKFIFHLGYFLPSFDTTLRVDNERLGRGDDVNLEKELGVDVEETVVRGEMLWRISERNRLSLEIFNFNRSGGKSIEKQIQIGDQIYPVGANLSSNFNFTIVPIAWSYSFLKNSDWEISAGAGLQWSEIRLRIEGDVSSSPITTSREAHASANAPLPLITLETQYHILENWVAGAEVGFFTYKMAAANMILQGNILDASIKTEWWFTPYVGVGVAMNWFYIGVTVDGAKWNGAFNYEYLGPQLYLSARF